MNERVAFFAGVAAAEAGASAVLLATPLAAAHLPYAPPVELALSHALETAAIWAAVAGSTWLLSPKLWRLRHNLSTKLRLLAVICGLVIVFDNMVSLSIYASPAGSADDVLAGMGRLLILRSVAAVVFFWIAVLITQRVYHLRRPHDTPPPKFGKEP